MKRETLKFETEAPEDVISFGWGNRILFPIELIETEVMFDLRDDYDEVLAKKIGCIRHLLLHNSTVPEWQRKKIISENQKPCAPTAVARMKKWLASVSVRTGAFATLSPRPSGVPSVIVLVRSGQRDLREWLLREMPRLTVITTDDAMLHGDFRQMPPPKKALPPPESSDA